MTVYELPPEPELGTIVLTAKGLAAQRPEKAWVVVGSPLGRPWGQLLALGPLTIVHPAPAPEPKSDTRVVFGIDSDEELVRRLRKAVRIRGGNVQVAFGSGSAPEPPEVV